MDGTTTRPAPPAAVPGHLRPRQTSSSNSGPQLGPDKTVATQCRWKRLDIPLIAHQRLALHCCRRQPRARDMSAQTRSMRPPALQIRHQRVYIKSGDEMARCSPTRRAWSATMQFRALQLKLHKVKILSCIRFRRRDLDSYFERLPRRVAEAPRHFIEHLRASGLLRRPSGLPRAA